MAKAKNRGRGRPRLPGVWVRLDTKIPKLMMEAIEAEAKMTGKTLRGMVTLILESRYDKDHRNKHVDGRLTAISCAYQDPSMLLSNRMAGKKAGEK